MAAEAVTAHYYRKTSYSKIISSALLTADEVFELHTNYLPICT